MNLNVTRGFLSVMIILVCTASIFAVPMTINYQGIVNTGGNAFDGTGLFRFAIMDSSGTVQYWSNDGNDPPVNVVPLVVENGLLAVILGDSGLMDPLLASVFDNDDIYLRIWFDDLQGSGFQMLTPDQQITSVGFAIRAQTAMTAMEADTVDGYEGSDLEESAEIDADIVTHAAAADAHHTKTIYFTELTDTATDAQIPDDITVNYSMGSGDADTIDGMHYNDSWPTSLLNIQIAASYDFHEIGGTDAVDDEDADATNELQTLVDVLVQDNDAAGTDMVNLGNVGIGTTNPTSPLQIIGLPEYTDNAAALSDGLTIGGCYHTAGVLKIVREPTGTLYSTDTIVGNMRHVTGGTFTQGSPDGTGMDPEEGCRESNETQFTHTLTRDIAVMETEVTRQMWVDLKAVQSSLPSDPSNLTYSPTMSHPVQTLTWFESVLFANLLSLQNGFTRCYYTESGFITPVDETNYTAGPFYCNFNADGYRLATEGEWEYFCRAGTTGAFSCNETTYTDLTCESPFCEISEFPILQQHCVYCTNDPGGPDVAGSKLSNPWNLQDVHGNVFEWCWDFSGTYPSGSVINYAGESTGSYRVRRGGGYNNGSSNCRSAYRQWSTPGNYGQYLGFRLVRTIL